MGQDAETEIEARSATPAPVTLPAEPAPRFCGRYTNTVDAKSRVVLPASFRGPFLAGGGLLTVWQGQCLAAMAPTEFDRYAAHMARQLAAINEPHPDAILRALWGATSEFKLDVQGRLVLAEDLRSEVGIGTEVRFQGFGRRVELWPADASPADEAERADHLATIGMLQSSYDLPDLGS